MRNQIILSLFFTIATLTTYGQQIDWLDLYGYDIDPNTTVLTKNLSSGSAHAFSSSVIEAGAVGSFQISDFYRDGISVNHPSVQSGSINLFLTPSTVTSYDFSEVIANSYSIRIGIIFPEGGLSPGSWKANIYAPGNVLLNSSDGILPHKDMVLKVEKLNNAINLIYDGVENPTKDITETITNIPQNVDYRITVTNLVDKLSFEYQASGFSTQSGGGGQILPPASTDELNWMISRSYDIEGKYRTASIGYYDCLARPTQSQSKDILTGRMWASETRYDYQGRPALQTLAAPLGGTPSFFVYKEDFIKRPDGSIYSTNHFATNPEIPLVVGEEEGTLGWYYSNSNDLEPFQDNTNRPYSNTVYDVLNPGQVRAVVGGKEKDANNNGSADDFLDRFPQGFSYTMPAAQELYYAFGKDYFNGDEVSGLGKEVVMRANKSVSIDAHGNEVVVFTDLEGKTLAAARTDGPTTYEVVSLIGTQGYVDVHIPKGINNQDIDILGADYHAYNLRTGESVNPNSFTGGNIYRLVSNFNSGNFDSTTYINSNGDINYNGGARGIKYKVNYYDFSLNYFDEANNLVQSVQPLGFDLAAFNLSTGLPNHTLTSSYHYNAAGELLSTSNPDEGAAQFVYREDGQIIFSRNSEQLNSLEFSYTHYDDLGRPVESGVCDGDLPYFQSTASNVPSFLVDTSLITSGGSITKSTGSDNWFYSGFVSNESSGTGNFSLSFDFPTNKEGVIGVSQSSPDGNYTTVEYGMYFNNNSINILNNGASLTRNSATYSANDVFSIERNANTLYFKKNDQVIYQFSPTPGLQGPFPDYFIDGSIYSQGTTISNIELEQLSSSESTNPPPPEDWTLDPTTCKEQVFTEYDLPDTAGLNQVLPGGVTGVERVQQFVAGNVSKTYTKNPETSTTWYSYDVYGRVDWMVQFINGLGAKTIDYEYDDVTGQINRVIYQKDDLNELFVHRYTYNDLGQLVRVETSTDNQNFDEHATYAYYETGQLKRTNLAEGLQGMDYVYTLEGNLKAINHSNLIQSHDPGQDANDAFGIVLDYHKKDYTRTTGTNINASSSGVNRFDGNIKGTRWGTDGLSTDSGYSYEYNTNSWLKKATFGSFTNNVFSAHSNNDYSVPSISYDANGNILSLIRNKNTDAGSNDMDALDYEYNPGTNQLNYIYDAVNGGNHGDIGTQAPNNYTYNSIGQLVSNGQDQTAYNYYTNGLVKSVVSTASGSNEGVEFFYNDRGHRVEKRTTNSLGHVPQTFYVRDASGQVLAIHHFNNVPGSKIVTGYTEYPIYGASRLGTYNAGGYIYELTDHLGNVRGVIQRNGVQTPIVSEDFSSSSIPNGWDHDTSVTLSIDNEQLKADVTPGQSNFVTLEFPVTAGNTYKISFDLDLDDTPNNLGYFANDGGNINNQENNIAYENGNYILNYTPEQSGTSYLNFQLHQAQTTAITNIFYLDNVNILDITTNTPPVMLAYKDYYPFGMPMPNRNIEGEYRYTYQGQEKDSETGMEAFELRLWDSRIGRWLTVDPYGQYFSPYMGMGNNPVLEIDPDGGMSCPNGDCAQTVSSIVAEGYTPLSGDLGGLGSNEPLLFGGAVQNLDEVIVNTTRSSPKANVENLFLTGIAFSLSEVGDYVHLQSREFSLFRDHFNSPINKDKVLFSLDKKTTPKVTTTLRGLGYGISFYSTVDNELNYRSGEIDRVSRNYSHLLNGFGTFTPAPVSLAIAGGDYIGTKYNVPIMNQVTNEEAVTHKTIVNLLKIMGIPPSKEVHDQWKNQN